jgi:hypothetical protein
MCRGTKRVGRNPNTQLPESVTFRGQRKAKANYECQKQLLLHGYPRLKLLIGNRPNRKSLLAPPGALARKSEARQRAFPWRRVTKVGPEVKHGLIPQRGPQQGKSRLSSHCSKHGIQARRAHDLGRKRPEIFPCFRAERNRSITWISSGH